MEIPDNEEDMHAAIAELHGVLKETLENHIEASGHTIQSHKKENVYTGTPYAEVIGENGAAYYIRRRYQPDRVPNWALNNQDIMQAFFMKKSIRNQSTIIATKCGTEWVHPSLHTSEE